MWHSKLFCFQFLENISLLQTCRALSNSRFQYCSEALSLALGFFITAVLWRFLRYRVLGVDLRSFRLYADVTAHMRMFGFSGFCLRGALYTSSAPCKARGRSALRAALTSVHISVQGFYVNVLVMFF